MLECMFLLKVATWVTVLAELIAVILYAIHFFGTEKRLEPIMQKMLWAITATHFLLLASRGIYFQRHPMGTTFEAVFSFALVISVLYTFIEKKIGVRDTGLIVLGLAFVIRFSALLSCDFQKAASTLLENRWFAYHTGAVIIGCAAFLMAAIYGALYIVLYWQLKRSHFTRLFDRLPSLEVLNEMNIYAAGYGLAFFSASLAFGMRWWKLDRGTYFSSDPKLIISFFVCLVFALQVGGHRFWGWNGKRLAYLSLLGFSLVLFSATIVNFFTSTAHGVR